MGEEGSAIGPLVAAVGTATDALAALAAPADFAGERDDALQEYERGQDQAVTDFKGIYDEQRRLFRAAKDAFDDAKVAAAEANLALMTNDDDSLTVDLIAALKTAQDDVRTKEAAKFNAEDNFYKYQDEYNRLRNERIAVKDAAKDLKVTEALEAYEADEEAQEEWTNDVYNPWFNARQVFVDALDELEAVDAADQDADAIAEAQSALDDFDNNGVAARPA